MITANIKLNNGVIISIENDNPIISTEGLFKVSEHDIYKILYKHLKELNLMFEEYKNTCKEFDQNIPKIIENAKLFPLFNDNNFNLSVKTIYFYTHIGEFMKKMLLQHIFSIHL
jgi:hypothetical protein